MSKYVVSKLKNVIEGRRVLSVLANEGGLGLAEKFNTKQISPDGYGWFNACAMNKDYTVICKEEDLIVVKDSSNRAYDGFPPSIFVDPNEGYHVYLLKDIPIGCERYTSGHTLEEAQDNALFGNNKADIQVNKTDHNVQSWSMRYAVVPDKIMREFLDSQKPAKVDQVKADPYADFPPCELNDDTNGRRVYLMSNIPVGCKRYLNGDTVAEAMNALARFPDKLVSDPKPPRTGSREAEYMAVVTNDEMRRVLVLGKKEDISVNYLKSDPITVPMPAGWPPYLYRDEEKKLGVYKLSDIPVGCSRYTCGDSVAAALGWWRTCISRYNNNHYAVGGYMAVVDDAEMVKALDFKVPPTINDNGPPKKQAEKSVANVCQAKPTCPADTTDEKLAKTTHDTMSVADSPFFRQRTKPIYTNEMRAAWSAELRRKIKASEDKQRADTMIYVDREYEDYE